MEAAPRCQRFPSPWPSPARGEGICPLPLEGEGWGEGVNSVIIYVNLNNHPAVSIILLSG